MSHDLVVRGGTVVDGTRAEPFSADVAVDGDQIVEIGKVDAKGKREIDAHGLTVSPGFIDLHTHLDAQVGWDPHVTSVSWHGVTTALFGNCGVTFAPCRASDREFLAGMMETVEDIPKQAILHGLPWNWESYGGYLDALDGLGPSINICGLVGHCATRFYVMGERAVEEPATEDEIREIAKLAGPTVVPSPAPLPPGTRCAPWPKKWVPTVASCKRYPISASSTRRWTSSPTRRG